MGKNIKMRKARKVEAKANSTESKSSPCDWLVYLLKRHDW